MNRAPLESDGNPFLEPPPDAMRIPFWGFLASAVALGAVVGIILNLITP